MQKYANMQNKIREYNIYHLMCNSIRIKIFIIFLYAIISGVARGKRGNVPPLIRVFNQDVC